MNDGTVSEFLDRWTRRADELRHLRAHVDAGVLLDDLLTELRAVASREASEPVTLGEASKLGGYSVDHLQRLVATGEIENIGRKNRPRIRRADVPRKAGYPLPAKDSEDYFSARRRIVASVITGEAS